MPSKKTYALTDMAVKDSLYLEIEGTKFPVTQFNASWAENEIPQAQCLLGIGRDAKSEGAATPSPVHNNNKYKQMTKAKVWFTPSGEYSPDGTVWPEGPQVIFEGYFMGFNQRKMVGKTQIVASLVHWLIDMACSSCCVKNGHAANPTQLNVASVMQSLPTTGAAPPSTNPQICYVSFLVPAQAIELDAVTDMWKAIKTLFCALANIPGSAAGREHRCGGDGDFTVNDRALLALKKMEGEGGDCNFEATDGGPDYYVPLSIEGFPELAQRAIGQDIGQQTIAAYANVSFWDKLVGEFCPAYGMAVVPCVQRALVVADLPTYNGGVWKTLEHTEYDSLDIPGSLERPLRAIGVVAQWASQTGAGLGDAGSDMIAVGGCYTEDSVDPNDGLVQYIAAPRWLELIHFAGAYAGDVTGLKDNSPSKAAGSDATGTAATEQTAETLGVDLSPLYERYAHSIYAQEMLRGRFGMMSGKLRFDIAPGSLLRIKQKAEQFLGAEDDLAMDQIVCVNRVTVTINAEAPMAATSFHLSHVRREDPENKESRTSTSEHPLFGTNLHGTDEAKPGCPLIPAYDL